MTITREDITLDKFLESYNNGVFGSLPSSDLMKIAALLKIDEELKRLINMRK